jgi:hypothetical protein
MDDATAGSKQDFARRSLAVRPKLAMGDSWFCGNRDLRYRLWAHAASVGEEKVKAAKSFESMQRPQQRLAYVIPVTLVVIFVLLYLNTRSRRGWPEALIKYSLLSCMGRFVPAGSRTLVVT